MFHAHRNHSSRLSPKRDTPLLPTRYASFGIKVFHYKCRKDTIISFIRQTISNFFLIRSSNYHQFSSISLHSTICTTCLMLQRPAFLPHVPSVQCSLPLYPMLPVPGPGTSPPHSWVPSVAIPSQQQPVSRPMKTEKALQHFRLKGFLTIKTAATYSPTGVQYHRRGRA